MTQLVKIESDFKNEAAAISQIGDVSVDDFDKEYQKLLKEMQKCNRQGSKRADDFGNDIEDLLYQFGAKDINSLNSTTTVDGMQIEEILSTIDPISKGQIRNPVRNKHCKHIYDLDTIKEAIKVSETKRVRCPQVGCSNKKSVEVSDLVEDRNLKRKFMILVQQQTQREAEEEEN
jgi:hypothetical protein